MEKTKSYKGKILAALCAAVVCIVVIGVSVFAATSNLVTIGDSIAITQSGQTLVTATVGKVNATSLNDIFDPAEAGHITNMTGQSYSNIATAAAGANGVFVSGNSTQVGSAGNGEVAVVSGLNTVFSASTGVDYVAYKFVFTNTSTDTAANISISFTNFSTIAANNELDAYIFSGSTWITTYTTKGTTYGPIALTNSIGGTPSATIYLVIAPNMALGNLAPMAAQNFKINVAITAA